MLSGYEETDTDNKPSYNEEIDISDSGNGLENVISQIRMLKNEIMRIKTVSMYRMFFISIGIGIFCFIFGFLYGKAS